MVAVEAGQTVTWKDGSTFVANENFCYCTVCWDSTYHSSQNYDLHDIVWQNCGNLLNTLIYCARCGYIVAHTEHDFFTENKYVSDSVHECFCGLDQHKHHINETSKKCDGGYHWKNIYNDEGHIIDGEWIVVERAVDDGCEHDWKEEDDPSGTADIPCWCGRGKGKRYHVFCGNIRGDGNQLPFQDTGRECPPPKPTPDPPPVGPDVGGSWTIEWDDEITIKWFLYWRGDMPTGGPFPVQWGTKKFTGDSHYKPKSFRVMRYATWLDWWKDL